MRRREKEIESEEEMVEILRGTKYVTIAMCSKGQPYLATLSHGYDAEMHCIYFHCAKEGKKLEILKANNIVWGQALRDKGYVVGSCDHLFETVQFQGSFKMIEDLAEKEHALRVMIHSLEPDPQKVIDEQINKKSLSRVGIGRIDISSMSGKRADKVVIST